MKGPKTLVDDQSALLVSGAITRELLSVFGLGDRSYKVNRKVPGCDSTTSLLCRIAEANKVHDCDHGQHIYSSVT